VVANLDLALMFIFLWELRLPEFGSETVRVCVMFLVMFLVSLHYQISGSKVGVVFGQESARTQCGGEGIPLSLLGNVSALGTPARVDAQLLRQKALMRRRLVAARLDRYPFSC